MANNEVSTKRASFDATIPQAPTAELSPPTTMTTMSSSSLSPSSLSSSLSAFSSQSRVELCDVENHRGLSLQVSTEAQSAFPTTDDESSMDSARRSPSPQLSTDSGLGGFLPSSTTSFPSSHLAADGDGDASYTSFSPSPAHVPSEEENEATATLLSSPASTLTQPPRINISAIQSRSSKPSLLPVLRKQSSQLSLSLSSLDYQSALSSSTLLSSSSLSPLAEQSSSTSSPSPSTQKSDGGRYTGGGAHTGGSSAELFRKLRAELDAERRVSQQLRRERASDVQRAREDERHRAAAAVNEAVAAGQRSTGLAAERHAAELVSTRRQHEREMARVRAELARYQERLQQEMTRRGLSASVRTTFEAERTKWLHETRDLAAAKRKLEESLRQAADDEKRLQQELRQIQETCRVQLTKASKDADAEIRKLLDELKAKDHQIALLSDRTMAAVPERIAQHKPGFEPGQQQTVENAVRRKDSSAAASAAAAAVVADSADVAAVAVVTAAEVQDNSNNFSSSLAYKDESAQTCAPTSDVGGWSSNHSELEKKIAELDSTASRLQGRCAALETEKQQALDRLTDNESRLEALRAKNREFLEKNIEVTNVKRELEDRLRALDEQNQALKQKTLDDEVQLKDLHDQLSKTTSDRETTETLTKQLEQLRHTSSDHEKTIAALRLTCLEKDRRLDLLTRRQLKRRSLKAQQKVVRFLLPGESLPVTSGGFPSSSAVGDDDIQSVDSELSVSSCLSSSQLSSDITAMDDEVAVFDTLAREELMKNYELLMKEHVQLERAHSILQDSNSKTPTNQQEATWFAERDALHNALRILKTKLRNLEQTHEELQQQLRDLAEQNEELEFQTLELQEANDKLNVVSSASVMWIFSSVWNDSGILQMYTDQCGLLEISVGELRSRLQEISNIQTGMLTDDQRVCLQQTCTLFDLAKKKKVPTATLR